MSLKSVSGGLDGFAQKTIGSTVPIVQKQTQDLGTTATAITSSTTPGEFPGEKTRDRVDPQDDSSGPWYAPMTAYVKNIIPNMLDWFESTVKWFLAVIFPPPRQAAIFEAALEKPYATSFLICQLICCGVPFLVFLAGTFLFAAVAALLWAILSFLIMGPIFLVACMMGASLWSWGLVLYAVFKWVDQTFLGSAITKFWLSQLPKKEASQEPPEKAKPKEEER
ncbi:seipin co-factor family protein [Aspergillus alliaceus]|uniref:seipin co-factor family protein n=1 Tax=Petromyces alliaceus TaxID=209559 RepID=UPI0012A3FDB0|nr:uncharacterized protein BDW43DRAFT_289643 [Aspergillus alliaceus]KAB8229033.1 hypothetical protein BDW43DRAFT_289643 [Aspergillus alliaceus]